MWFNVSLTAYVLIAIVAFGHSAANADCTDAPSHMSCKEHKAFTGVFAGLFWPLYFSWEAFE